jgi:hypothetical protein
MTINTPLLETAIDATPNPKWGTRLDRFVNAKADLIDGVEKKHIWNVDFVAAKDNLSRGIDSVMDNIYDASLPEFWRVCDIKDLNRNHNWTLQQRTFEAHEEFGMSCQMNQAAGRIKRLSKFMDLKNVPEYVAVLKEVVLLHELVQAAKPFIEKGRKPAENPTPVDLTNTAECAICAKTFKMTGEQKMVHHGFEISGGTGHYFGFRRGSCLGTGRTPYELSCEANKEYIPVLQNHLTNTQEYLLKLVAEEFEIHIEIRQKLEGHRFVAESIEHKRGTRQYKSLKEKNIRQAEAEIREIESMIVWHEHKIKVWKRKPLFGEGA